MANKARPSQKCALEILDRAAQPGFVALVPEVSAAHVIFIRLQTWCSCADQRRLLWRRQCHPQPGRNRASDLVLDGKDVFQLPVIAFRPLFRDAIGEILVIGVVAHVHERQHRNRALIGGEFLRRRRRRALAISTAAVAHECDDTTGNDKQRGKHQEFRTGHALRATLAVVPRNDQRGNEANAEQRDERAQMSFAVIASLNGIRLISCRTRVTDEVALLLRFSMQHLQTCWRTIIPRKSQEGWQKAVSSAVERLA
ncbi:MAG: hypothetical protein ACT443_02900 [Gemmatimonadota bacterium]